jgi:hypothetical protein
MRLAFAAYYLSEEHFYELAGDRFADSVFSIRVRRLDRATVWEPAGARNQ